ncbi:SRPBCC family protein [Nonomuraea muscovyensis]|uniref:Carbon monoxide dehydrogenase subunit G n=1 Tax=Nonomuraea muscovyensis TaxID=1124761 RepID=A0A7X0CAJ6_9ACTN|nr:SRPBCC family protein [Nonomuraea muscovyensis]MBB6350535.1 carbon monoxide dehydrogenase subunit G [Nonomuraea muscovyensis]MDF2707373.1 carbon monoxide dehydrogenase [Nonomuraea muscovyensis]
MAMRFEHEFTVPVPVEQAWAVLLDVERVAPCLPGASLDTVEGERFTGRMKVKVGPITVAYRGTAEFEDVDKDTHTLTIKASGKEDRGAGTASATVRARLTPAGGATAVAVETSFNVTGRPAQFGRGVMAEVGGKLIDRFAANLSDLLSEQHPPHDEPAGDEPARDERAVRAESEEEARPAGTLRTSRTPDEEALDLLELAGTPVLKRLAPVAAAVAALLLLGWLIRRRMR